MIDDSGPCFALHGPKNRWHKVTGQGHKKALRWVNALQQSAPSNWARWQVKPAKAGKYTVQYYAVAAYARFKRARYVVRHAGTSKMVLVDQSEGKTGWRILGTFHFAAGGGQHVSVHDDTSSPVAKNQHIAVDAIRLVPAANKPPTPPPPPKTKKKGPPPSKTPPAPDGGAPWASPDGDVPGTYDPGQEWPGYGQVSGGCSVTDGAPLPGWTALLVLGLLLVRRRRRRQK